MILCLRQPWLSAQKNHFKGYLLRCTAIIGLLTYTKYAARPIFCAPCNYHLKDVFLM